MTSIPGFVNFSIDEFKSLPVRVGRNGHLIRPAVTRVEVEEIQESLMPISGIPSVKVPVLDDMPPADNEDDPDTELLGLNVASVRTIYKLPPDLLPTPDYTDINKDGPRVRIRLPAYSVYRLFRKRGVVDMLVPDQYLTNRDKAMYRPDRENLARFAYQYLLDKGHEPIGLHVPELYTYVNNWVARHGLLGERPLVYDYETAGYTREYRFAVAGDRKARRRVVPVIYDEENDNSVVFPFVIDGRYLRNTPHFRRILARLAFDLNLLTELTEFLDMDMANLMKGIE